jgi:hypothetical protein
MGSGHADFPPGEWKELEWIPILLKRGRGECVALHYCQLYFYTHMRSSRKPRSKGVTRPASLG